MGTATHFLKVFLRLLNDVRLSQGQLDGGVAIFPVQQLSFTDTNAVSHGGYDGVALPD